MKKFIVLFFIILISCNDNPVESLPEPTVDDIVFSPLSLLLYPDIYSVNIVFKGTDFVKFNFDSIFIDNFKLTIINNAKDSLIASLNLDTTGTFDVIYYQKGEKFVLPQKITINYAISKINFKYFTFIIKKMVTQEHYVYNFRSRSTGQVNEETFGKVYQFDKLPDTLFLSEPSIFSKNKISYKVGFNEDNLFDKISLFLDKHLLIQRISYSTAPYGKTSPYGTLVIDLKNLNMGVKDESGQSYAYVNLMGSDIDKCYPYYGYFFEYSEIEGSKSLHWSKSSVMKMDSVNNIPVNYYPSEQDSQVNIILF